MNLVFRADTGPPTVKKDGMFKRPSPRCLRLLALLTLPTWLGGCASYGERVAPVPLPEARAEHVDVAGAQVLAQRFADEEEANRTFGFDIRGAGLLPVRLVIDNQGREDVQVSPQQAFLIDDQGQAWPLLTVEQAYQRIQSHVELGETAKGAGKPAALLGTAGAIAGAAVGIVTGRSVGEAAARGAAAGAAAGAILGARDGMRNSTAGSGRTSCRNRCRTSGFRPVSWPTVTSSSQAYLYRGLTPFLFVSY
jgi:hypothetical protein